MRVPRVLVRAKERAEPIVKNFEWTWTTAVVFSLGFAFFSVITMAVIPSFWLYFADGTLKWTGTFTVPYGFGELELPMQAVRDVIVVIWYGLALGLFGFGIHLYNKRNPKTLPSGEEKREATGGYK